MFVLTLTDKGVAIAPPSGSIVRMPPHERRVTDTPLSSSCQTGQNQSVVPAQARAGGSLQRADRHCDGHADT
jgi:hypothetical protein